MMSEIVQPIRFAKKIPSPESLRSATIVGPRATMLLLARIDGGVLIHVAIQLVFQRLATASMLIDDDRHAEQGRADIVTQRCDVAKNTPTEGER
jgi:hypothetical protein